MFCGNQGKWENQLISVDHNGEILKTKYVLDTYLNFITRKKSQKCNDYILTVTHDFYVWKRSGIDERPV